MRSKFRVHPGVIRLELTLPAAVQMNSFCVDELVLSFDELQPFSDVLQDETQLPRLLKLYKNLDKHNDASFIRHVLVLVSCMEKCLQADPPLVKKLQNCLVEFTSLIENTKETTSKNYYEIAVGILFKYSSALLLIQEETDSELGLFLDAVAYHYLCSASSTDPNISAWIALQALEAGAAITYSYVVEKKNIELCERDDLAEFCVDSLIPSDGRIHRLHAGVFRDVISTAPTIWPAITVKRVQELFERLTPVLHKPDVLRIILWMIGHDSTFENLSLFDPMFSKSPLKESNDPDSSNLTAIDVKCFLFTLSLWSDSVADPALVPARLRIRADHFNCWKAVCQLLDSDSNSETAKSLLLQSRIMDSVRLRHRVVDLRRLFEMFRWLEANARNDLWLTLYATNISEIITGVHSHRRKCDDLFPYGTETDVDLSVDEVDRIQEHVSRYLASQFLSKNEFSYAEQLLIYANSLECKTLLIKVYDKWLNEGTLEEPKRGQLLKRIRDLETECSNSILHGRSTSTNSVASILSAGDNAASTTQSTSHKILVDACTNTPIRGDTSMLSRGDDASFFSVRSDRISATEESFESAIASPLGPNVSSKSNVSSPPRSVQPTSPLACGGADMVHVKGNTIKEEKPLVTSHSTSTNGVIVVTEKSDDGVLPEDLSHPPLTPSKSGITKSPGVIIKNSNAPMMTGSPVPIVVTKSPFGPPVINKEVAASFWKSGKSSGASLLGLFNKSGSNVQPGITPNTSTVGVPGVIGTVPPTVLLPKTQSPPVFSSSNSTIIQSKSGGNLEMTSAASTSVFGGSAQTLHIPSSSASTSGPSFLNSVSAPNLLPRQPPIMPNSLTPQEFGLNEPFSKPGIMPQMKPQYEFRNSLSSPITANGLTDNQDEDEQFCNNLLIEMSRKKLESCGKKSIAKEVSLDDMSVLQRRISEIEKQMRGVRSQLHVNTDMAPIPSSAAPRSAPTQAELLRDLLELEQQVAQYVSPADVQGAPSAGSGDNSSTCADPMNLFRGLLMSSNAADSQIASKQSNLPSSYKSGSQESTPIRLSKPNPLENPLLRMEQMARHPGCNGVCLGCMDDDSQDRALRELTRLSEEWNADTDSETD
ncbi:hypothetical protein RB195_008889 [Necator americanus]|uniref:Uncharacterized protein n=2 Tax=Necator americanus TaxID=51031 RepID=A0ABR1CSN3_NECAM